MVQGERIGVQRKRGRNWLLRLLFSLLAFAYIGLTVFTNNKTISTDHLHHLDQALPAIHSKGHDNKNQTKPLADGILRSVRLQGSDDSATKEILNISTIDKSDQNPSLEKSTLDGSTRNIQAALAVARKRRKAFKKQKQIRGVQEAKLQKHLNLTLDFSDFDPKVMHESLLDFYHVPVDNTSRLWDDPQSRLPEWMKRYLRWHTYMKSQLANETIANGPNPIKVIVMQCLESDDHCGGVSDRLKPLPFMLRHAYYTKRMLLIYWNRPRILEAFLLPPKGGMDWRVPPWMVPTIEKRRSGVFTFSDDTLRSWSRTDLTLVRSRFQDYHGGMYHYDAQLVEEDVSFADVFHDLWRIAFTPSPPVRELLESDMTRLGLIPGQYVGAHLRALYAIDDRSKRVTRNWAKNAMNCATELRSRKTIFFVSDSSNATLYAREYAAERNATIITRTPNPNPPLHMDKVHDWLTRNISDFYDSFIDIYIMAHADCLTYNKGGYGLLGLYMSRNSSCGLRQDAIDRPKIHHPCMWVDDPQHGTQATRDNMPLNPFVSNKSIYGEPMDIVSPL